VALPQLDDGLVALRFSEDHREAARWLKEKRDTVAALPAPQDAATAEEQAKKLANLVRCCSVRHPSRCGLLTAVSMSRPSHGECSTMRWLRTTSA